MQPARLDFIPYPAVERHGLIGDRRTAALVAADGTIDWLCFPEFDGHVHFGALVDARRGGHFRLGPEIPRHGRQRYLGETATLETRWSDRGADLVLRDVFAWPEAHRRAEVASRYAIVRRLRCERGRARCTLVCAPRPELGDAPKADRVAEGVAFRPGTLLLATSTRVELHDGCARAEFELGEGEEIWAVLEHGDEPFAAWSDERAADVARAAANWWRECHALGELPADRAERLRGAARGVELLCYEPSGSIVAAPTSSLPERIGGDRNYDYRFTWVRDASLAATAFTLLGELDRARRFLDWLAGLRSSTDAPLQVCYGMRGDTKLDEHARKDLEGYRESKPVLFGNRAYKQTQHGSLGYVADCALMYLEEGGAWRPEHARLVARLASHIERVWDTPDSGIWELEQCHDFVSSRVMCWVVLDRAIRIAEKIGDATNVPRWRATRQKIFDEVLERGWSEKLGAFRQRYDADTLDASLLLVPVMGFLPADDPRVTSTVDRLVENLSIDGLLYRFIPSETPGQEKLPLGQFEGAFLPCTFWLATTYAMAGRFDDARAALARVERCGFELDLFPEEIDARSGTGLGNFPSLFSQAEYVRAVLTLEKSKRR
ncbi:MAG TPA: glycoside hydrolase family 15 protein [Polyangiaceae bacterium]|jgi:GH15 family glucan-1,4-alpha-glucosidase